ncbi:MAG: dynamin family protein [Xenococcaceae cyanobacterium]
MSAKIETTNLLNDLDKIAKMRSEVAICLGRIAETLERWELEAENTSGGLGLERDIKDLKIARKNLRKGVFRLLVLGDMKRGKSTFLNALIGENLLPTDVNPSTAVLTVLRYGLEKKVIVYFKEDKRPQKLDLTTFKQQYTIEPEEANKLEQDNKPAFPKVDYAAVEYPLPLLEKGIEIIDTPGLNDTETRNELSLGYINNCHAILFVLRASQPCTLEERRYLENYIKGRGLTVFFLINAWDEIRESLIDPDDPEELEEAETRLRQVFESNLAQYCQVDGDDIYDERVFEISSINALRRRLKNPDSRLKGTGFPEFMGSLKTFLTKERAIAQLRQARIIARQAYKRVHEAVERRIPLLDQDVNELKRKMSSVEPEFNKLINIRNQFKEEIRTVRDRQARAIADSFRDYVLNLGNTFESDFLRYQPELKFLDYLNEGKRQAFEAAFTQEFEKYINDKLSAWSITAEQKMNAGFEQLSKSAANYGADYAKVTHKITEKLIGQEIQPETSTSNEKSSPGWAKWAMGLVSLASGNIAGVAMAGVGFDWKDILLNMITVIGIGGILAAISGGIIGPVILGVVGLGFGALQVDKARQRLVTSTRKELVKHLPKVAQEQWQPIYDAVKECFDVYEREVTERVNDDIQSQKAELDNLLKQKESREINRETELKRLRSLKANVLSECEGIESVYEYLLLSPVG